MILSNYFIKKKISELIAHPPVRLRAFRSWNEVRHILVFYEARDQEIIKPCLETLRKSHKQVTACVYAPASGAGPFPDGDRIVGSKDVNLLGFPSPETRRAVGEIKADLLIDLSRPGCYPLQYLLLQHPCPFKAGCKAGGPDLYDLSISVTGQDNIQYLFEQILFYLQSIHSK